MGGKDANILRGARSIGSHIGRWCSLAWKSYYGL